MSGSIGGAFARRGYSEVTAREIDTAIKDIVDRAFERARRILTRNRDALQHAATALLEKETLGESDLTAVFGSIALPADDHDALRGAA